MTSTPPAVTSSTKQVLAMAALAHHSSRTRLSAAARSGVARMVRATMSSSGPREVATRSRNQPLIASRTRAPMSKKPGPLPNGGGSVSSRRSRKPASPGGGAVEVVGGAAVVVVGGGGPRVLDEGGGGLGAVGADQADGPRSRTVSSTASVAAARLAVPRGSRMRRIGSHPDDLLEQGDQRGRQRRQPVADRGGPHAPLGLLDLLGLAGGEQVAHPGDGELQGGQRGDDVAGAVDDP